MTWLRCVDKVGFLDLLSSGTLTSHPSPTPDEEACPTKLIIAEQREQKVYFCVLRKRSVPEGTKPYVCTYFSQSHQILIDFHPLKISGEKMDRSHVSKNSLHEQLLILGS